MVNTKVRVLRPTVFEDHSIWHCLSHHDDLICFSPRRADGGVSNNSFVMQMTADLIGQVIDKPKHTDMSSLGAAFLAGLAVGEYFTKFHPLLKVPESCIRSKNDNGRIHIFFIIQPQFWLKYWLYAPMCPFCALRDLVQQGGTEETERTWASFWTTA